MALHKPLLRSFAGGVITPEMWGRLDLDKFQTGLAEATNFLVLPHGPLVNRAGFAYVLETKDSTKASRVIPFAFSATQTMVLEFGHQYVRFHTAGGTLLETGLTITGISQANPGVLTYTGSDPSNGNVMYLSGIAGMTELNGRYVKVAAVNAGANTFQLTDLAGANINTSAFTAYTSGGTAARVYEIASPYTEAMLESLKFTQSADVLTIVTPQAAPYELRRLGATNWTLTAAAFAPAVSAPGSPLATPSHVLATTTYNYAITAVLATTFEESIASATATCTNDLTLAAHYNDVTWAAVTGATRYNVYKEKNGLFGYIGQTDALTFRDDNITQDLLKTPPELATPFVGAGNFPSTVTYMEQRKAFAATDNQPQNVWMTRSATENNLSQSIPTQDDDAIIMRIAASQQNRIRHLVPLGDLIALTAGGEFRIFAGNADVMTPSNAIPKPQSFVGANDVQPIVAENACLYVQAQGGHMRELVYGGDVGSASAAAALYRTNDISLLAPHLFDDHEIIDLAWTRSPVQILWAVRDDGVLLALTYVPGQNVRAWTQCETDGIFESICAVAEGGEDVLYAIVQREIDGRDVRYVERLHSRVFAALEDAFFVDSGLTYDGAAATEISGLYHLEGATVSALADGAVVRNLTVTEGAITLPAAASKVHVGLPIVADMQTLPLTLEVGGYGQGAPKNVSKVHLSVYRSGLFQVGPDTGHLTTARIRTTEPYGSPPDLKTGWVETLVEPQWQKDGSVSVREHDPLPLTIRAMVLEVSGG